MAHDRVEFSRYHHSLLTAVEVWRRLVFGAFEQMMIDMRHAGRDSWLLLLSLAMRWRLFGESVLRLIRQRRK